MKYPNSKNTNADENKQGISYDLFKDKPSITSS